MEVVAVAEGAAAKDAAYRHIEESMYLLER